MGSQGSLLRSVPRVGVPSTLRLHDRPCALQVVHCALQCTYYALLWQIVAATDRLPPQVGERCGGQACGPQWS